MIKYRIIYCVIKNDNIQRSHWNSRGTTHGFGPHDLMFDGRKDRVDRSEWLMPLMDLLFVKRRVKENCCNVSLEIT